MRLHYPLNSQGAEDAGKLPWTDGVPSTGAEGSYPGHALVTDMEAEILAAIDAAGLVRSGSDLTQLVQAIARGGLWLGPIGGTSTALTATIPNNVVIPSLQAGMRVRGIAASNYPGGGGTLAITGVGGAAAVMSCPIVGPDGVAALAAGAWKAGQFLTFEIDASGNARFGGGLSSVAPLASLTLTKGAQQTLSDAQKTDITWSAPGAAPPFCTFDGVNLTGWTAGKYRFRWVVQFSTSINAAADINSNAFLNRNGADLTQYAGDGQQYHSVVASYKNTAEFYTPMLDVVANDTFKMRAYSTSPASTSLLLLATDAFLNVERFA